MTNMTTQPVTREQIEESIGTTWRKLEEAVQKELDAILSGEAKLNASSAQAFTKFMEASRTMADQMPNLAHLRANYADLPTFNDDDEEFEEWPKPITKPEPPAPPVQNKRGRPRKNNP
jgi:hypothetical protein